MLVPPTRAVSVLEVSFTMRARIAMGACVAAALLVGSVLAAGALKSGPQVGDGLVPFEPLNVTGPFAGDKQCLV